MIYVIAYYWRKLIDAVTRRKRLHAHRCDDCGKVWRHTSEAQGCEVSHMCPQCGSGPYWAKYETPGPPWC